MPPQAGHLLVEIVGRFDADVACGVGNNGCGATGGVGGEAGCASGGATTHFLQVYSSLSGLYTPQRM